MFVIKRNQVIITALVVMIAVAGYLNYTDNRVDIPAGFVYSEEGDISALIPDTNPNNNEYAIPASVSNSETITYENLTNADVIADNIGIALTQENGAEAQPTEQPQENGETSQVPAEDAVQTTVEDEQPDPGEALYVNLPTDSSYFIQAKLDREQSRSKQRELLLELINNQNLEQEKKAECADAMLDIQKKIEKESAAEAMIEAKGFNEVFVRIDDDTVDVVVNKESLSDAEIAQIEDIIKRKTGMEAENIRISTMKK